MKNLLVSFICALFSIGLALAMASIAVGQNLAEPEAVVDERSVDVKIQVDDTEIADIVNDIIDDLPALDDDYGKALSSHDKQRLKSHIQKLIKSGSLQNSHGGFFDALVPIVALCLTLGLPVIILSIVLWSSARKRRQMMDLAQSFINADKPIPEHLISEFGSGSTAPRRLHDGVFLLLVGAAVGIFLGNVANWEVATLALIPMAIGLSRIIYWRFESDKAKTKAVE